MDMLSKLAAPATAKIRQLQKIVQDIKKNDGSFLNKLRRLKTKTCPKLPARDYREDDQWSEPDYDNDQYEDLREVQDDSYEPPPSHRVFTTSPSASFPMAEYLDNCHILPKIAPRKPLRPTKASKQLPPEPPLGESDEEDYINAHDGNGDDNYVEPAGSPSSNAGRHCRSRERMVRPMMPIPLTERPIHPVAVSERERNSCSLPTSRPCQTPTTHSHSLPPKPSPRLNMRLSPITVQESTGDDQYEVCDADNQTNDRCKEPPPLHPKPLPRERSPKPPVAQKPALKSREFESRTLPVMQTEQKPPMKTFTLDLKRPKFPLPQFNAFQAADRSVSADSDSTDQDKVAEVYNKCWYAGTCDRKTADDILFRSNKDGAFMVRRSSGQDALQPYTLVVFYKSKVYNIPVRFIPATQQYALGREKRGEEYFNSISCIIENHQKNLLVLIDSQNNNKDATKLCHPLIP